MNLQTKAVFIIVIILFFALGSNTAVLTFITSSKYKQAILAKTSAVGEGMEAELNKVLSLGVPIESIEGLSEKLQEIVGRDKAIGYAMVVDTAGQVLFHNENSKIGERLKDPASRKASSSRERLIQTIHSFYDLSFPLVNAEEKIVGVLRIGVRLERIQSQLYELLFWALGISVFTFLGSLALVYLFISKFITRPIMEMEDVADRMASSDLTCTIHVEGKDEVASLGKAINKMSLNLKEMLAKIRDITNSISKVTPDVVAASQEVLKSAEVQKKAIEEASASTDAFNHSIASLAKNADSLLESSENTSSAVFQMTQSIENLSESADVFDTSAHETASSIQEMAASIRQITQSIENLSASSDEISSSVAVVNSNIGEIERRANESVDLAENVTMNASGKGLSAIEAAMKGMENIRKSVRALVDKINRLGERSEDIGKILNVISDVTEQTNLLSLNAAILAAQAGEHGSAFTVVANEIRSLAERTASSTKEIEDLIISVQRDTDSSVQMAAEGIQTVEQGLELVHNVNEALLEIVDSSKVSTEMSKAIRQATSEQSQGIKQIRGAITKMTEQVEQISLAVSEQDKGSQLIIKTAEKMKEMSHQVNVATTQQKDGSRLITRDMENVTQQAGQIAKTTNKQKQRSSEIVRSMEDIRRTTTYLRDSSSLAKEAIRSLESEARKLVSELQKFKV